MEMDLCSVIVIGGVVMDMILSSVIVNSDVFMGIVMDVACGEIAFAGRNTGIVERHLQRTLLLCMFIGSIELSAILHRKLGRRRRHFHR